LGSAKDTALCCECKNSFHPGCTRIGSLESFKKQNTAYKASWKCDQCKEGGAAVGTTKVENILTESKILERLESMQLYIKQEFCVVNNNVSDVNKQLLTVNESIESIHKSLEVLTKENEDRKNEHLQVVEEIQAGREEVEKLKAQIRDMEQYTRRNNLEVVGVPVSTGEDIYSLIEKIAEVIGVDFHREDISVAHRVPKPRRSTPGTNPHPNIIISFVSRTAKSAWRTAAKGKKLNTTQLSDSFTQRSFYLNDHLTPYFKDVLWEARNLVRENKLAYAWVDECKVLVKKSTTSTTRRLTSKEDIAQYLEEK